MQAFVGSLNFTIAKVMAVLDHLCNFRRNHRLPRCVVVLNSPQNIAREDMQYAFVEIIELLDPASLDEMTVQTVQVSGHLQSLHRGDFAGGLVEQGIHVDPQVLGE